MLEGVGAVHFGACSSPAAAATTAKEVSTSTWATAAAERWIRRHLGGRLLPQLAEQLVLQGGELSWAERMVCSSSLSSWVMYRSQLVRVCLRM